MPDHDRQEHDGGFRLNLVAITIAHLLILGGLLSVSLSQPNKKQENIVWLNPRSFGGNPAKGETASAGNPEPTPPPGEEVGETPPSEPEKSPEAPPPTRTLPEPTPLRPEPTPPPAATDLPLPTPTPLATPRSTPKPSPCPTPKPSPTPKPKPSSTPKLTPKATPSPTPKETSKPSPKPSPKPSVSPKPTHEPESTPKEKAKEKPEAEISPKPDTSPKPKASPAKPDDKNKSKASPSPSPHSGEAKNTKSSNGQSASQSGGVSRTNAGGGHGAGAGSGSGDSALAAYVGILTNRFQAAWNQPTGEMAMGKTLQVTVKLKVEADGRVTEFTIIEGSGNAVVDDSVREAGKRITKLPSPPNKEPFSAPVRFELGN